MERSAAKRNAGSLTWGRLSLLTFFGGRKESECAAGRTSRPLRSMPNHKARLRGATASAGRKAHRGKPHRKAHCRKPRCQSRHKRHRKPDGKPHHMPAPSHPATSKKIAKAEQGPAKTAVFLSTLCGASKRPKPPSRRGRHAAFRAGFEQGPAKAAVFSRHFGHMPPAAHIPASAAHARASSAKARPGPRAAMIPLARPLGSACKGRGGRGLARQVRAGAPGGSLAAQLPAVGGF